MIRRPPWWPEALWPRVADRSDGERADLPPPAPGRRDDLRPVDSFLRTLTTAFGADGAILFRLDRGDAEWRRERSYGGETAPAADAFRAEGHPLTWALREGLVLQVASEELFGARVPGWSVTGPVRSADRVLVLTFRGSPPTGARDGVRPALEHLGQLHGAGLL